MYYANLTINGPLKYRNVVALIGVLGAIDNHTLIWEGILSRVDENGLAVWTLKVHEKNCLGDGSSSIVSSDPRNEPATGRARQAWPRSFRGRAGAGP